MILMIITAIYIYQVRAKTRAGTGQWSVGRTLGCDLVIATPPSESMSVQPDHPVKVDYAMF